MQHVNIVKVILIVIVLQLSVSSHWDESIPYIHDNSLLECSYWCLWSSRMFLLILLIFFLTNTIVANSRCSNIPECSGCSLCHMTIMWRPIRANFQHLLVDSGCVIALLMSSRFSVMGQGCAAHSICHSAVPMSWIHNPDKYIRSIEDSIIYKLQPTLIQLARLLCPDIGSISACLSSQFQHP